MFLYSKPIPYPGMGMFVGSVIPSLWQTGNPDDSGFKALALTAWDFYDANILANLATPEVALAQLDLLADDTYKRMRPYNPDLAILGGGSLYPVINSVHGLDFGTYLISNGSPVYIDLSLNFLDGSSFAFLDDTPFTSLS